MKKKSVSKRLMMCLCIPFSSMSNNQKCFFQRWNNGFFSVNLNRHDSSAHWGRTEKKNKFNCSPDKLSRFPIMLAKVLHSEQWRQTQIYLLIKPASSGDFERMERKWIIFYISFLIYFSLYLGNIIKISPWFIDGVFLAFLKQASKQKPSNEIDHMVMTGFNFWFN